MRTVLQYKSEQGCPPATSALAVSNMWHKSYNTFDSINERSGG